MAEDTAGEESTAPAQAGWIEDTQDALNRTIDALQTAWDTSRDSRLAALNSAKRTVDDLTAAVEEGIAAASARWAEGQTAAPDAADDDGEASSDEAAPDDD
jgi:type II secretory pathway component PulJ